MITGHLQGRLLSLLSKMLQPRYILEIGTYTGYSALCLAEGLQPGGELHTIDSNEELYEFQRGYFDRSPRGADIYQHTGNALDVIPTLDRTFDLVFIDAEKKEYLSYLDIILHKTQTSRELISDNVLWSGKVLDPPAKGDQATSILQEYNRRLKEDDNLETVMLPLRDGLAITRVR
jgi:predicted O-methyltransferase YrrM